MKNNKTNIIGTELPPRLTLQEFAVDVLGGLVPGILFTIASLCALFPTIRVFVAALTSSIDQPSISGLIVQFLNSTRNTPNMIWVGSFVFALILSYVLGHLFYRRDPKIPDRASFQLITRKPNEEEVKKDGGLDEWKRKNFACTNVKECEFPYPYLDKYLEKRGHKHLLPLVTWKGEERFRRSKTHINVLKIRLFFHFPTKCRQIIRNEAHVRLATSMWYVGRALYYICAFGTVTCTIALFIALFRLHFRTPWDTLTWYLPSLIGPMVIFTLAYYCRFVTEKFMHYQRLREVFYVLEFAHIASVEKPEMFKDLINHNAKPSQ